jgi:MATE family multidrug resistance protein
MFILLAGVGLNAGLNWVFIYGNLGMPPLGLTGAGLATLISRVLGALVTFWWLRRDAKVRAAWPQRWLGGYSRTRFREMFGVGVPASTMLFFENTAFAFSGIMVGWLGSVPLAAHQIAISCASTVFMIPLGLAIAAGMRISHAVGAGDRAQLRPIGFSVIGLAVIVTFGFAVALGAGGRGIAAWFVQDAAVIAIAAHLMMVAALFQMVDGVQVIAANLLRGVGDVKIPTAITLIAYWIIALPVGYLIGIRGPLAAPGVWLGIAGGLTFAAVFLTARFARLTRPGGQGC